MHHSRTAFGLFGKSSSWVTPAMVITSFITVAPVTGSTMVALGSRIAILLTPSPPTDA